MAQLFSLGGITRSRFMNNTPSQIMIYLQMLLWELPTLIVCLVACFMILTKRDTVSRGSLWALFGFGSVLILYIVQPAVQMIVQSWAIQGEPRADRWWAFSVVAIVSSVLHAAAYLFLLIAVLSRRTPSSSTNPPPLISQ